MGYAHQIIVCCSSDKLKIFIGGNSIEIDGGTNKMRIEIETNYGFGWATNN